jgi:hypothetical protein
MAAASTNFHAGRWNPITRLDIRTSVLEIRVRQRKEWAMLPWPSTVAAALQTCRFPGRRCRLVVVEASPGED